jgi:L-aminopeptidase/D-esterase-like protein
LVKSQYISAMPNIDSAGDSAWKRLGLAIGHASDHEGATGCTIIRGVDAPFRCAAHVLGRASGTRELHTCDAQHLVDRTDAVLFAGGSAYGLDAAAGVMRRMEERSCGTTFDGDVIFATCPLTGPTAPMPTVETLAVAAMERAIERSVRQSVGRDGIPGLGDTVMASAPC